MITCRVRLDHAFATIDWCTLFPLASLRHLQVVKSNHLLILLLNNMEACNQRIGKSRPFRYEVMWERHEGFQVLVEEV